MIIPILFSVALIAVVWTAFDALLHRVVLAPLYKANPGLWRPAEQMSVALVSVVSLVLVAFFIVTYIALIEPKSLHSGMVFGALVGIALGVSAGFGTYIHSPIPISLAWGWFVGGWLKAFAAGTIIGLLIH